MTSMGSGSAKGGAAYARLGYATIAIAFGACGVWAYLAPLDSAAIAPGHVAVETHRKPIQHLEGGIVKEIRVKEAQTVRAGEVLFRIEPVKFQANIDILQDKLVASLARKGRLVAERDNNAPEISWPKELLVHAGSAKAAAVMESERQLFVERKTLLDTEARILKSRVSQAKEEIDGQTRQLASIDAQMRSLEEDLSMLRKLKVKQLYPATKFRKLERERLRLGSEAARVRSEISRTREQIQEWQLRVRKLGLQRVEAAASSLVATDAEIASLAQQIAVARDALARTDVTAPDDGVILSLTVHAPGAVVAPGETLAEIVPSNDKLLIDARVSPLDIDVVAAGQRALVRFPAFASRDAPIIHGFVASISADAVADRALGRSYYLARIGIRENEMPKSMVLVPGMPAEVVIATGERTALQYIMAPLANILATSMREH